MNKALNIITSALYIPRLCQLVLYSSVVDKKGQPLTLAINNVYPLDDALRVLNELGLKEVELELELELLKEQGHSES